MPNTSTDQVLHPLNQLNWKSISQTNVIDQGPFCGLPHQI